MVETIHNFTLLTFDSPVRTGSSLSAAYMPYHNVKTPISFASADISTFGVIDDDDSFDRIYQDIDPTLQTLAEATRFGNDAAETPAGTRLTHWHGVLIEQLDAEGAPTGNFFRLQFPIDIGGNVLGGKLAVMMFPMSQTDAGGAVTWPAFDPAADYRYVKPVYIGSAHPTGYDYAPSAPCFTQGTLIETESGPRRVETLRPGDHIRTRDNGLRRLQWAGCKRLDTAALDVNPALRPIVIAPGALGPGLPARRLTVSPQHRVLVRVRRLPGGKPGGEHLVAAKHLVGLPGISVANPPDGVAYWHILFDGHELVNSNGTWTESLYTGPEALKSLTPAARREILSLFPELGDRAVATPPARPFLTGRQGRDLMRRHSRTGRALVEA